jgi:uncharacterized protein YbaA (DUF1428 family)
MGRERAAIFREYGCIEIVESWEDNIPSGKYTDFRRAVDAKDGVMRSDPCAP